MGKIENLKLKIEKAHAAAASIFNFQFSIFNSSPAGAAR
jgi:hypothetical protein